MSLQVKPFFVRKTQKYFMSEIVLFIVQSFMFLSRSSRISSSILLILILLISLKVHKARLYSPIIIFSVALYTIRSIFQIQSWFYYIFELMISVLSVALSFTIRVFQIPHRYALYEQKYKDPSHTVGFLSKNLNDTPTSIWYPSQQQTNKNVPWIISHKDYRTLYQIFYVDAAQKRTIPFWLFKFCISYLGTYDLQAHYGARVENKQKYKVIIFSHGLGAHSRGYTCYTHWWAKQGYIVISVQHDHDEPCVNYTVEKEKQGQQKWLYAKRNQQIVRRKSEIVSVFEYIEKQGLNQLFGQKIEIESIMFAGHSFGGGSILEAGSQIIQSPIYNKVSRYLCLDPWIFPLSSTSYKNLDRPILFINSQKFVRVNPQFYQLHAKNQQYLDLNPKMSKILIRGLQHLHPSDTLFTFGTIFVLTGSIKNFGKRMLYVDILAYMIRLFEDNKTGQEIIELVEKQIKSKLPKQQRYLKMDQRKLWRD